MIRINKLWILVLTPVVTVLIAGCANEHAPRGIYVDFEQTRQVKKLIGMNDSRYFPAYKILLEKADLALGEGPFSVVNKKRVPPSGDKHDYVSMGPYWWPDTTRADGLPYIRRDGEINPETRGEYTDVPAKNKLLGNLEILSWAFYFSENETYAAKAVELLKTWFVNPETRMNPNLNFAQGIPGRTDGRGIGIIDWAGIQRLISPLQILEAEKSIDPVTLQEIKRWLEEYLNWLLTSKNGVDEDNYFNNHGTWYDVQVVGIMQYLGKKEEAVQRLENKTRARIASQIEPDGSQPHELARTKALGYSTMNLRGFLHLVKLGRNVGVDLWSFSTDEGRSIRKALEFLKPYVIREKEWNYQQLGSMDDALENTKIDFLMAAWLTGNEEYKTIAGTIVNPGENIETLLYPLLP